MFRETMTRITNHSGSHDHVWKRVISKTPSHFPTFASEKKATLNGHDLQEKEERMRAT